MIKYKAIKEGKTRKEDNRYNIGLGSLTYYARG